MSKHQTATPGPKCFTQSKVLLLLQNASCMELHTWQCVLLHANQMSCLKNSALICIWTQISCREQPLHALSKLIVFRVLQPCKALVHAFQSRVHSGLHGPIQHLAQSLIRLDLVHRPTVLQHSCQQHIDTAVCTGCCHKQLPGPGASCPAPAA